MPWTVFIPAGTGVLGTAGSDHQKATVILGAVPRLIDLMYPHTIVITDKVHDASCVSFATRIVDVLSVDDTSTYVCEVLGAGDAIGSLVTFQRSFQRAPEQPLRRGLGEVSCSTCERAAVPTVRRSTTLSRGRRVCPSMSMRELGGIENRLSCSRAT